MSLSLLDMPSASLTSLLIVTEVAQSFYKILELDDKRNEATIEEIKDSYRRLAHRWHPDKKGGKVEKFQMIQKAYLTLGNKLRRETYDQM